eukprot:CAMPEP_0179002170 /NCGR_PEP_ID=MMETSP0795-20121207/11825_1 /TAXON_ID=88552 /ORGANISM="Amoebophrya sp., Strain Ameob2" /LENGTH=304 /DNA_ID=CAMNT_0020695741 /DNA_START=208 /DNA_END=1122 /DNA_ORIENTATION=-
MRCSKVVLFLPATLVAAQSGGLFDNLRAALGGTAASPTLDTEQKAAPVDVSEGASTLEEMDLLCMNGTHAQAWFNVQQKMRYILGPDAAFNGLDKSNTLEPALYSVLEDMQSTGNADVCGVGKLMVQLLSICAVDSDGTTIKQQIEGNEPLTSPLMTLLLDIPWNAYQPMWPMFGFLAQLAMRRVLAGVNAEAVDGLAQPELQQFASALNVGIINGDLEALKALSQAFIDAGSDAVAQSPLGFMTAVFTQAAVANSTEEAQALFFESQKVMKKMIFTPGDLDTTLSTRWPLWGMAYLASLKTVA